MAKGKDETERFLKEAFCINGECKLVKAGQIDGLKAVQFRLTDSKRGTFYVTISK